MLQNLGDILKGRRWLALLVLIPLALLFGLWGTAGLVDLSFGAPKYGLKVNGEEIPTAQLQQAWQERQSQFQQQLKTDIPAAVRTQLQNQLFDQYTRETLMRQRATERGFRAGDKAVINAYRDQAAFQVEGKFSEESAKIVLAQNGLTPAAYEERLRRELQIGQLERSLEIGDFLTASELKRAFALENEQREVRYVLLPVAPYAAAVKVDDARARAWYDAHADEYLSKESVRLQYAELRLDTVAAAITVNPADLEAWYQQNQARYIEPEKRRASHILIASTGKDAAADAAALAKAQQVLKEVRAGGDFAALAKKYSQDPGSARQGGDLGWALRGAYVQPFAEKLFAMKAGEISEPVKTQYGYHIIRLDAVQPEHGKTLADARAQIEGDFRRERASDVFGDRQEQLQQKIETTSGADLAALAREFGLTMGEVPEYTRGGGGALGVNVDLSSVVFSDTVLKDQRIGGPVALADDRLVIVKALEHHLPKPRPLAEVRADIDAAVAREEGTKAARAAAEAARQELVAGASLEAVAKQLKVTASPTVFMGRGDPQPPAQIRDAAFAATNVGVGKPSYQVIAMDEGGAAIVAVLSVKPGTTAGNSINDQQLMMSVGQHHSEADLQAYLAEMQRRATIRRNPAIFN
jgi:peptidyl-prolyl cis-trans isomerase D